MSELALALLMLFSTNAPAAVPRGLDAALLGAWEGSAQFVVYVQGAKSPSEHDVIPITFNLKGDFTVDGSGSTSGCKFLGVASPMPMAGADASAKLDLLGTNCKYGNFNTRLVGVVTVRNGAKVAELTLKGSGDHRRMEITGTLKRPLPKPAK